MTAARPTTGILVRLEQETRPEHEAIETALGLIQSTLTHAAFRRTLERFYGFYRPLEVKLQATLGLTGHRFDLTERLKTPFLDADLHALGVEFPNLLPVCASLPVLTHEVNCFGCLYVLEGSILGGQLISRHVRQAIGVTPETGGRFFHGYGDRTAQMWLHFRAAVTAFLVSPADQDAAVAAAKDTFQKLHRSTAAQGDSP